MGTAIAVVISIIVLVAAVWLIIQLLPIDHDDENYQV